MKKFFALSLALMLVFISAPIFAAKAEAAAPVAAELAVAPVVPSAVPSADATVIKVLGGIQVLLVFLFAVTGALCCAVAYLAYLIREKSVIATIKDTPHGKPKARVIQRKRAPKTPSAAAASPGGEKKRPGRKPKAAAGSGGASVIGDA